MSHQLTFADSEFNNKRRKIRKEIFLSRINELMPWNQLEAVIETVYPKAGNGRSPYPLSTMFRIDYMQHCNNMSNPTMGMPIMGLRPCACLLTYR
jgi:IS5 family transposase